MNDYIELSPEDLGIDPGLLDYVDRKDYSREHGFIDNYDRKKFLNETKGFSLLDKMEYLINNAQTFGLDRNIYYLNGVCSRNYVSFHDQIVWSVRYNYKDKNHNRISLTYAELKETLGIIHPNMILDVLSIKELLAKGKSNQWNEEIYRSPDGVEFCVFNQLKTPKQRIRALAFAICQRDWLLEVEESDD